MKNVLSILALTALASCAHNIYNGQGYARPPQKYKFSYAKAKTHLTDTLLIDTMAIYYLSHANYANSDKNSDRYIRFYSDGRLKLQGVKTFPKVDDINDIQKGLVGYYKIEGNVVKLQIYTDINAGSDQLQFGLIDQNRNLILLNENPRTNFCIGYSENGIRRKISKATNLKPKVYVKTKIKGMTYEKPNW